MKLSLIFALLFFVSVAQAQDYAVPANYRFNKKSDYAKYEPKVVEAIKWLTNNAPNKDKGRRKEASAFFLKWLEGAPNVTATIYPEVLEIAKENPDLLFIFLGAWTQYQLKEGKEGPDKKAFTTSLKSTLAYYKTYKNKGIVKDRAVEMLLKKDRKGQLDAWIDSVVKS